MGLNNGGDAGQPPFSFDFENQGLPPALGGVVKWGTVLIGIIIFFVLLNIARGIYTDLLWYDILGLKSVFLKILTTRIWLFFSGAIVFAILLSVNIYLANKFSGGEINLPLPQSSIELVRKLYLWGLGLAVFFVSLIFGAVVQDKWETFLRFINSVKFGETDPVYGKDIAFYVFTLPVFHFIQGWLLGAFIVTILAVLGLYFLNATLRGTPFAFTTPLRVHISVLGAALLFIIAWGHFLGRWELLFSSEGAVFGASYTDIHVRKGVLLALTFIAGAAGVLMLVNTHYKGLRLMIGAAALWMVLAIVLGAIYPSLVQRFSVTPSEFTKEAPYIARSIDFTKRGYALDRVNQETFPAEQVVSVEDIQQNSETINNIRLWDHRPLRNVYNQIQFIRLYYTFLDIDVDRYTIDGEYRQVMLGTRELDTDNLPPEAQGWVNQTLQYTHGMGVAVSPVTDFTPEGRPNFLAQDIPPQGVLTIDEPRIYYGENTSGYVIVNTKIEEFDYPTQDDLPVYTKYQGEGGVRMSSLLRRISYAWEFADVNILVSGEITSDSRIKYRRNIQERIHKVAPFLMLDEDPYMVIVDGELFWIQDAYTTTDRYPYSERFEDSFNYIRNSVKVVMDPTDGFLDFYIADETDPLVKTLEGVFPDLFKPLSEMSPGLQEHIRYPKDFFSIQAEKYLTFHMENPQVFYNKEDQWDVPSELFFGSAQAMEPYYLIMRLPGEEKEEFVLLLPFTPAARPNLVGWLAARSDGANYGSLVSFEFPKDRQIDGPQQIEARIDTDTDISGQFTLWDQQGSSVLRGNLLVIPLGKSLLYIEPIYLQAEALAFPELKRVIAVSGQKVAMEESLGAALSKVVGTRVNVSPPGGGDPETPTETIPLPPELAEFLDSLSEGVTGLQEELSNLEEILRELEDQVDGQ